MTKAICYNCGSIKFGAFVRCKQCGSRPQNDDELAISLAMTSHYFNDETMEVIAADVKRGEKIRLDEASKANILKTFEEAGMVMENIRGTRRSEIKSTKDKKPFWKFW